MKVVKNEKMKIYLTQDERQSLVKAWVVMRGIVNALENNCNNVEDIFVENDIARFFYDNFDEARAVLEYLRSDSPLVVED